MRTFAALLASASLLFAGCALQNDAGNDEGAVEQSEDALVASKLVGSWEAVSGPIYTIDFTADYAETLGGFLKGKGFTATVDNGVRCITTPCDSVDEVGGVYKTTKGTVLTLASFDRPSLAFSRYLGDYTMSLSKSGILTLKKTDGTVVSQLKKAAAGEKCGTITCGAGLVCCNPLMNICTKPGMMCIQ